MIEIRSYIFYFRSADAIYFKTVRLILNIMLVTQLKYQYCTKVLNPMKPVEKYDIIINVKCSSLYYNEYIFVYGK